MITTLKNKLEGVFQKCSRQRNKLNAEQDFKVLDQLFLAGLPLT